MAACALLRRQVGRDSQRTQPASGERSALDRFSVTHAGQGGLSHDAYKRTHSDSNMPSCRESARIRDFVIRLRSLLERGCTHPVLGPILLVLLVLMLAMLFLHFAEDGHGVESFGALCVALAVFLGSLALEPLGRLGHRPVSSSRTDRGPPAPHCVRRPRLLAGPDPPLALSLPLRR